MLYFTLIHFFCVCTSYSACIGLLVVGSVGPVETVYANSLLTDLFWCLVVVWVFFPLLLPLARLFTGGSNVVVMGRRWVMTRPSCVVASGMGRE